MSSEKTKVRETDRKERTKRARGEGREPGAWLRPRSRVLEPAAPGRASVGGLAAVLALRVLACLPLRLAHWLGMSGGRLLALLPTGARKVTRINLRIAFPEKTPAERARLARASLAHMGRAMAELGAVWTWERERILGLVRSIEGEETLRAALAEGRGVVAISPHLGSWELAALYLTMHHPFVALYRPPRRSELERFAQRGRSRFGGQLLPASARAVRELLRELAAGGLVGAMPDQDSGDGAGIFVPFFGELANTGVLVPRLLERTGARLIFVYAEREARGAGFHLRYVAASDAAHSTDLATAAAALNRDIERLVRSMPEQYLWSYRRYRIRPPGMQDPYKTSGL
jgi:KDO2-lipid IV(A) lauroyltransferase